MIDLQVMRSKLTEDHAYMLGAKELADTSNCKKRRIGCIFRVGNLVFGAANTSALSCNSCHKDATGCSAIHAEVSAIMKAKEWATFPYTRLYLWAEIPCLGCLSFIKEYSSTCQIHCLSLSSYANIYPNVLLYDIEARRNYASALNIPIFEHNMDYILNEYEEVQSELNRPTGLEPS